MNMSSESVWVCSALSPLATLMAPKESPYAPVASPMPIALVVIGRLLPSGVFVKDFLRTWRCGGKVTRHQ
ncbi:unannotated protein [freshwater metagenome]|uniref:Unannotated protein n=1 Tax=freshwater metagenome TaxID=449393 RepID=A0A6J7ACS2_9ZZZZ